MTHHRTLFPFLVIAMTLALGTFIFFAFRSQFVATLNNGNGRVDAVEYQANAHAVVKSLRHDLAAATDETAAVEVLAQAQRELLLLVVPADYKDVHLEMVITLSQWATGFAQADEAKKTAAQEQWGRLVATYPWIE